MTQIRFFSHVYNRGVDKRKIFLNDNHRHRFITTLRLSRLSKSPPLSILDRWLKEGKIKPEKIARAEEEFGPPLLDILAFVLMGNHFHLVLGESEERKSALSKFMQRVGTAFTMYFNKIEKRKGRLFESQYKSVAIVHDEQLLQTVRYIHVNPTNSEYAKWGEATLPEYRWSSLPYYLNKSKPWLNTQLVISLLGKQNEFWNYTKQGIRQPMNNLLSKELRIESIKD